MRAVSNLRLVIGKFVCFLFCVFGFCRSHEADSECHHICVVVRNGCCGSGHRHRIWDQWGDGGKSGHFRASVSVRRGRQAKSVLMFHCPVCTLFWWSTSESPRRSDLLVHGGFIECFPGKKPFHCSCLSCLWSSL